MAQLLARVEDAVRVLAAINTRLEALAPAVSAGGLTPPASPPPRQYLSGPAEIMAALDLPHNDTMQYRRVIRLNGRTGGPIRGHGQGQGRRVDRAELLDWWNQLLDTLDRLDGERRQGQLDARATLQRQHNYG